MRAASWSPGWLLKHYTKTNKYWIAVVANAIAFMVFACLLVIQRIPAEFIDISELAFGVPVFTMFALIDIRCTKWGKPECSDKATL